MKQASVNQIILEKLDGNCNKILGKADLLIHVCK